MERSTARGSCRVGRDTCAAGGQFVRWCGDRARGPARGRALRERVAGVDLDALEAVRAAVSADASAPLVLNLFPEVRFNGVITMARL